MVGVVSAMVRDRVENEAFKIGLNFKRLPARNGRTYSHGNLASSIRYKGFRGFGSRKGHELGLFPFLPTSYMNLQ